MIRPREQILVVDPDQADRQALADLLAGQGYGVQTAPGFREAVAVLANTPFDVVCAAADLPDGGEGGIPAYCREHSPETVVVLLPAPGAADPAGQGAFDVLPKPVRPERLRLVVERALRHRDLVAENRALREQLEGRYRLDRLVGRDHRMQKALEVIRAVADTRVPVLITGESGTGKTLTARVLHRLGSRRDRPLVEVACGALPEALLERELFDPRVGKFTLANGGTILLKEVSALGASAQAKLLRVLEDMKSEPAGGNETQAVDVRVLMTAQAPLAERKFRRDLFHRANVVAIELPPLRERAGDIPALAEHFLQQFGRLNQRRLLGFAPEALAALQRYSWPGNVRELENVIERAVVLSKGPQVESASLPPTIGEGVPELAAAPFEPMPLKKALEEPERRIIQRTLQANQGNRQATAAVLGINRTTLYKKMKKYRLEIRRRRGITSQS